MDKPTELGETLLVDRRQPPSRPPRPSQREASEGSAGKAWRLTVAARGLALALAGASGCSASGPFVLRLHAHTDDECEQHEAPLEDAIAWWADHGANAFVYEACEIDEFETRPLIYERPDADPYTNDLAAASDHIPVYVVEQVTSDRGTEVVTANGLTLPDDAAWCQALMAIAAPSPGLFAHELGHLLWLDHSTLADNVMRPEQGAQDLDTVSIAEDQIATATSNLETSQRHCRAQHR